MQPSGPDPFKEKFEQGEDVFRKRRSLFFKKMPIISHGRPRKKLTKRELNGAPRIICSLGALLFLTPKLTSRLHSAMSSSVVEGTGRGCRL